MTTAKTTIALPIHTRREWMKKQLLALSAFCLLLPAAVPTSADDLTDNKKVVVGLDNYYNHEIQNGKQYHYTWEDTSQNGYSKLGELIRGLGAKTVSIRGPASQKALAGMDVYIIVDPDTPQETKNPHYLQDKEIEAIIVWVNRGGTLVLLGNDKNQAEFKHFNKLAGRFGITFNEETRKNSMDRKKLLMHSFPDHPFFTNVKNLHIVGMCTLRVEKPAEEVYNFQGDSIMAVCRCGKGKVFALGDPWCYNEYIDHADNRQCVTNLSKWLIGTRVGK